MFLFLKKFLALRNNARDNQRGSFLLEALLAVMILSVGLVGLIRGLLSSLNAAKQAASYSAAITVAENSLFDVMNLDGKKVNAMPELQTEQKELTTKIVLLPSKNLRVPEVLQEALVTVSWPGGLKNKEVHAATLVLRAQDEEK